MRSNSTTGPYSVLNTDVTVGHQTKRKRSWSRAVFSNLQRKGLEKRFEVQKYVTKPDRRQLAAMLGLTDAQVSQIYSALGSIKKKKMKNLQSVSNDKSFIFTFGMLKRSSNIDKR